jgi:mercuric ion transport protein
MKVPIARLTRNTGLIATGALAGAIAASTCCVVPLALALTGVTGVWIGSLTGLSPYQPLFVLLAALCIGIGFWRSYGSTGTACEGPECGTQASRRVTRAMLWVATAVLAVSATTS